MKVLLVHNFYKQFGGEDAAVLSEKQLLEGRSNQIVLYSRDNHEVDSLRLFGRINAVAGAVYSRRTVRELSVIAQQSRPEIAYIHNVFPLISPSVYHALDSLSIPSLQVIHDFRFLCPNGWFYTHGQVCERCKHGNYANAVRYRCYRDSYSLSALYSASLRINRSRGLLEKINAFICLTEFSRNKLLEVNIPQEKLFVRPNFIDCSVSSAAPGVGEYILYLGRLSPEKGLWTLISAFSHLKTIKLKIMGTGPLEGALRAYISERQIHNIELVGFKVGKEKWELLRGALFVIVPSEWYETFCMAVLEAYVAGKPVVASNIGSLPYVVEDNKSGLLFEPKNVSELIRKINYLLSTPAEIRVMGAYGRTLAETKYSVDQSYKRFQEIVSLIR